MEAKAPASKYMNTDCLTSPAVCPPSSVSISLFSVLKKVPAQALSRQFPFPPHAPVYRRTVFIQTITKIFDPILYPPRSEWKSMPSGAGRLLKTVLKAEIAVWQASISALKAQPTTVRS
jgi:hypothetical protein